VDMRSLWRSQIPKSKLPGLDLKPVIQTASCLEVSVEKGIGFGSYDPVKLICVPGAKGTL